MTLEIMRLWLSNVNMHRLCDSFSQWKRQNRKNGEKYAIFRNQQQNQINDESVRAPKP